MQLKLTPMHRNANIMQSSEQLDAYMADVLHMQHELDAACFMQAHPPMLHVVYIVQAYCLRVTLRWQGDPEAALIVACKVLQ